MSVIIIGGGPAGVSAALYILRAGIETTIIAKGVGALEKAEKIENYYGLSSVISGKELHEIGLAQAKSLGATVVVDEVVGMGFDGRLQVSTKENSYSADAVLLATGAARQSPPIQGLKNLEGKGVSYCAVCDAFFYRGKDVAVIGSGEYALHEAMELVATSGTVTLLTDGKPLTVTPPEGIKVKTEKITAVLGENAVEGVTFENGDSLAFSGIFVAMGTASSTDLAKKLGALCEGNKIAVQENKSTNIPGLYAAGDCTVGILQVAKAVCDGMTAGSSIIQFVRAKK